MARGHVSRPPLH